MRRLIFGATIFVLVTAGCGGSQPPTDAAEGGRLKVVASFYPLEEAAQQIGGPQVDVTNLTPPGAEPHDIELTSKQLDEIIDADVVLYIGGGFQPALEEAIDRVDGIALDVSGGARDPHIWLDPGRWAEAVDRVAETLADVDKENADLLSARAVDYSDQVEALEEEFEEGLAFCDRDLIVTNHASFGYLADSYGLEQQSISGLAPEVEPDPARLAELAELVEQNRVTTIYYETLVSVEVARTLADETDTQVAALDPLEGLTPDQIGNGEDYFSVMRSNLEALRQGLGCR